jgi:hypothetical protein
LVFGGHCEGFVHFGDGRSRIPSDSSPGAVEHRLCTSLAGRFLSEKENQTFTLTNTSSSPSSFSLDNGKHIRTVEDLTRIEQALI